LTLEVVPQ